MKIVFFCRKTRRKRKITPRTGVLRNGEHARRRAALPIHSRAGILVDMEIPLVFSVDKNGRLVYAIPLWYRIVLSAILVIVGVSVFVAGGDPGIGSWIIVAVLLLGILYEEKWIADPAAKLIRHRSGLVIAARPIDIPFAAIEGFALTSLVRGTIPGTEEEKAENKAAFAVLNGETDTRDMKPMDRLFRKKAFMNLVIKSNDGTVYLMNTMPTRRASSLREAGRRYAEICGVPFVEG